MLLSIVENLLERRPEFSKNCWNGLLAFIQYNIDEKRKREEDRFIGGYPYNHASIAAAKTEFGETIVKDVILDASLSCNTECLLDNTTCWLLDDALRMIAVDTEQMTKKSLLLIC